MTKKYKDLLIIGFSGFGKEVYWLASRLGIRVRGFLDDNPDAMGKSFHSVFVIGKVDEWVSHTDCELIIAIGNPRIRSAVYEKICKGGPPSFATLIDPTAIVSSDHVSVGPGSIICAGAVCTTDIKIGSHVIINLNCTVGHEVNIESFATIAPLVAISGNVLIGQMVEVGTGAAIKQGLTIKKGALVGMGSVLTKNVAANTGVFGSPAKVFKTFTD